MKKNYIEPKIERHEVQQRESILESSNINVGGSGRFDVKEDNTEWDFWEKE